MATQAAAQAVQLAAVVQQAASPGLRTPRTQCRCHGQQQRQPWAAHKRLQLHPLQRLPDPLVQLLTLLLLLLLLTLQLDRCPMTP